MKSAILAGPLALVISLGLVGCPANTYDAGYTLGFLRDDYYWDGFDDGFDTTDDDPVYYAGSDIPNVTAPEYKRGYYDGLWYAYNDGYFVDYDYAFTVGFSEGYDAAFFEDYLDFIATDQHVEYLNGGWGDGYNDGFSEGKIFGANDWEQGLPFDWIDAMNDYRSPTDLNFEEIPLGTGVYGPVILYVYGTDPLAKSTEAIRSSHQKASQIRGAGLPDDVRPMSDEVRQALDRAPITSYTNTATWLQRIEAYQAAAGAAKSLRVRAK